MIDYVGLEFLFDIWFFFGGRDGVDDITFTTLFQEVMGRVRDKYRPEAIVLQVFTLTKKTLISLFHIFIDKLFIHSIF